MSQVTLPSNDDSASDLVPAYCDSQILPVCDKCGAPIDTHDALVCRKCGWYSSIGAYVEIDRAWETADEVVVEPRDTLRIPAWAWTMMACVAAVVAESIAARVLTTDATRTTWSVTQLFAGLAVAFTCHLISFILFMREVSDAGLLDIVLKPIKPWILRIHELPAYQWLCHTGLSSLVAIVMSFFVIGGLPYEKLWDWGFEKPVKQNLIGAILDQAKGAGEEKPLEEAVQEFAGQAGIDDNGKAPPKPTVKPLSSERKFDDCLIIGYRANSEGLAYVLLLAGENYSKLKYVGQVTPQLSIKELRDLTQKLEGSQSFDPFVKLQMDGVTWVKPKLTCRVSYARKGKKGGLYDVKLESFLGEIGDVGGPARGAATKNVPAVGDIP